MRSPGCAVGGDGEVGFSCSGGGVINREWGSEAVAPVIVIELLLLSKVPASEGRADLGNPVGSVASLSLGNCRPGRRFRTRLC